MPESVSDILFYNKSLFAISYTGNIYSSSNLNNWTKLDVFCTELPALNFTKAFMYVQGKMELF